MFRKLCLLGVGSALLTGCFGTHTSQAPIATTYPISEQQKMQAAHHWDVLAEHQAGMLVDKFGNRPMYIQGADEETPFNSAFNSLLTSQLVSSGAIVKTSASGAASITYKVQVIEHKDQDPIRPPEGALTALAAGIAVATVPFNNWSEPALALIPAAGLADLFSGSATDETGQEVLITTQVKDAGQMLYSNSSIYYINRGDNGHYKVKEKPVNITDKW